MASFQQLLWLSLLLNARSQSKGAFEFLAPRENEVIVMDLTYMVKWTTTELVTGRGELALLAGPNPESLDGVWKIASLIDVAAGNLPWTVTVPRQLPVSFYALNLSLSGVFEVSPPFKITSTAELDDDDYDVDRSYPSDRSGGDDLPNTISSEGIHSMHPLYPFISTPITSSSTTSSGSNSLTPTPGDNNSETRPNDDEIVTSGGSDGPSSTAEPPSENPGFNGGEIANIAIGVSVALVSFGGLAGIVMYHRRRLAKKKKHKRKGSPSGPSENEDLEVYGKLAKSEATTDGPQAVVEERMYELDAQDEIREAGGRMKPAELYSAIVKP